MEAVLCKDYNQAVVEEVSRPTPDNREVLISVNRVQLSVTECSLFRGEEVSHYETTSSRLQDGSPRLFGHEFCGVVTELGSNVDSFVVGDRVYAPGKIPCHSCRYCQSNFYHLCLNKESIGYERPGAVAEYFTAPVDTLRKLPAGVSNAEGAAMQPLASTLLCVHEAQIQTGDVVAINGMGVMGYGAGQLALHDGASEVFGIDIVPEKLALAAERGMVPIDAREEDAAERIREETDGVGADVVFSAVGGEQESAVDGPDPIAQSFRTVRKGGRVVQIGHIAGEISIRPRVMRDKMVDWINPSRGTKPITPNSDTGELAPRRIAQGHVDIEAYITHELSGLGRFKEAVEITLDNSRGLGPAQIIVAE